MQQGCLMDWYPWYPADFERDTLHLSLAEEGAYRRLIDKYMTVVRGPLPDDDVALARMIGVSVEVWQTVAVKVRSFFRAKEGVLRHKRCEQELDAQKTRLKRFSERGKKAAFAKYSNPKYMGPRRMLVPPTIHNIYKNEPSALGAEGSSEEEENGVASSELARVVRGKWSK
jgi:uncharacterized protein YdaU (DUF1376 family)